MDFQDLEVNRKNKGNTRSTIFHGFVRSGNKSQKLGERHAQPYFMDFQDLETNLKIGRKIRSTILHGFSRP